MFELRAVGDVQIDGGDRVPRIFQRKHRLHFGGVGLGVIAIEVVVLCGGAPTHFDWAVLIGPVPRAETLVAIDVEHRDEHQHEFIQRAPRGLAFKHLPKREKTRILAVDLAGVDPALHQHHRNARRACGVCAQCAAVAGDQRFHWSAFRRSAEVDAADPVRIAPREGVAQGDYFVVATGTRVTAAFGFGGQRGRSGLRGIGVQGGSDQQERRDEKGRAHGEIGPEATGYCAAIVPATGMSMVIRNRPVRHAKIHVSMPEPP